MIVMKLVDEMIAAVNGAVVTLGTKWGGQYVLELMPQIKAEAQSIAYNGGYYANGLKRAANKSIHPDWLLTTSITIQGNVQINGAEFLIAQLPGGFIRINEKRHGIIYCGSANISADFHIQQTVTEIEDLKNRGFLKGKEICVVPVGSYLRFYGNKALKSLEVQIVPSDPLQFPGFNPLTDDYPVDPDTISIMKDLFVFRAMKEAGMVTDKVDDNSQTNEQAAIKQNIKFK